MTSEPIVDAGVDPLGDLVLTVRGDRNSTVPDYELPPAVPLDLASKVLGIDAADGLALAEIDGYPVPVITVHEKGFHVGTAHLIRAGGLAPVRKALRVRG